MPHYIYAGYIVIYFVCILLCSDWILFIWIVLNLWALTNCILLCLVFLYESFRIYKRSLFVLNRALFASLIYAG